MTTDERAALVRKIWCELSDIKSEAIETERGVDLEASADRIVAAVEAARWGPPVEPLTVGEIEGLAATGVAGYFSGGIEPWHSDRERERWHRATEAVLAALPERHRRIVLGVSGE